MQVPSVMLAAYLVEWFKICAQKGVIDSCTSFTETSVNSAVGIVKMIFYTQRHQRREGERGGERSRKSMNKKK